MPLSSIAKIFLTIVVFHSVVPVCVADDVPAGRILVEVWRGGDDDLTIRLGDALEEAFRKSLDFTLSYGEKPKTLIVRIPTNVRWKEVGRRNKVLSKIEFSSSKTHQVLRTSSVECWDDMLTKCAEKVVKDAKTAARKIR